MSILECPARRVGESPQWTRGQEFADRTEKEVETVEPIKPVIENGTCAMNTTTDGDTCMILETQPVIPVVEKPETIVAHVEVTQHVTEAEMPVILECTEKDDFVFVSTIPKGDDDSNFQVSQTSSIVCVPSKNQDDEIIVESTILDTSIACSQKVNGNDVDESKLELDEQNDADVSVNVEKKRNCQNWTWATS